jgi:hypothetical protein
LKLAVSGANGTKTQPLRSLNELVAEVALVIAAERLVNVKEPDMHMQQRASGRGEFVLGACIGMSLIADMLIETGVIDGDELESRLIEAVMLTRGQRQMPLLAMLWLLEELGSVN